MVEQGSKRAKRQTTRRQGGQPANRNAWRHGGRSGAAILKRRLARAELKAMAYLAVNLGLLPASSVKFRTLRLDQLALLRSHRPRLALALEEVLPL